MIIFTICIAVLMIGSAVFSYLASKEVLSKEVTQLQSRLEVLEDNHLRLEMEYGNLEAYSKHLRDENMRLAERLNHIELEKSHKQGTNY
ncbi:MAG: hypothetical protein KJP00_16425 [Bacteroidia bacterium]|nr:hypothetical protein [Bacteroidia bacterium]